MIMDIVLSSLLIDPDFDYDRSVTIFRVSENHVKISCWISFVLKLTICREFINIDS